MAIPQTHKPRTKRPATLRTVPTVPLPGAASQHREELLAIARAILVGAASLAANTANDARRLAQSLLAENHSQALAAVELAVDLEVLASDYHRAAEQACSAAGIETPVW